MVELSFPDRTRSLSPDVRVRSPGHTLAQFMHVTRCPKCSGTGRLIREVVSDFYEYFHCTVCGYVWMEQKRDPDLTAGHPATPPKGK